MKKVLFCKIEAPMYSSDSMSYAFNKVGYEVIHFNWQQYRFEYGLEKMRSELIRLSDNHKPDLIFLHIQNENIIDINTAKELSKNGFVVNFTEDVREDVSWYEQIAPIIGLTVFTNRDDVLSLQRKGIFNVAFMPTSFNHLWYKPQLQTNNYFGDIVFVGNNYLGMNLTFPKSKERFDMVQFMKKEFGDKFRQYGLNWGSESVLFNPQKAIECYNNTKIVITQNNFNRKGYQSDRFYNAVGCGAFVIAEYFEECEEQFRGKLITWKTLEQLRDLCRSALSNDFLREKKSLELCEYVLENHTWVNRFEQLNYIINDIVQQTYK